MKKNFCSPNDYARGLFFIFPVVSVKLNQVSDNI